MRKYYLICLCLLSLLTTSAEVAKSKQLDDLYQSPPSNNLELDFRSIFNAIGQVVTNRIKDIFCNRVTIFGMVVCPYDHLQKVYESPSNSSSTGEDESRETFRHRKPEKGRLKETHIPKSFQQLKKFTSRKHFKHNRVSITKNVYKRVCMEGKYVKELDKCLTFDDQRRTYEDADFFCKDLASGGRIWRNAEQTAAETDAILVSNSITPIRYSIWIDGIYLNESIVGEGVFDSKLRRRLNIGPIRGIATHKRRITLSIKGDEPYFKFISGDKRRSVVCQTFPLLMP